MTTLTIEKVRQSRKTIAVRINGEEKCYFLSGCTGDKKRHWTTFERNPLAFNSIDKSLFAFLRKAPDGTVFIINI